MHRTPPRRSARVAALLSSHRSWVLVVRDAWEVRAVRVSRSPQVLRRLLLQERPGAVVVLRRPRWLPGSPSLATVPVRALRAHGPTTDFPELRRFADSRHAHAIYQAAALAEQTLLRLV